VCYSDFYDEKELSQRQNARPRRNQMKQREGARNRQREEAREAA
jgi:hypothetical protein